MARASNESKRRDVEAFFVDANREGDPIEKLSPSGRYRLTICRYRTRPNGWNYTRGTVIRVSDGATACDIKRNLDGFHHSFVSKGEHEFLIAGRSYMSQTIVDLDRGAEYEPEGDHYHSGGFCWGACFLSPDGNTLAVDGCIWARPYEFRFFDFTDPARGWPRLPIVGAEVVEDPSDKQKPQWLDARTIDCHQVDHESLPQERTRLERRSGEMVVIEHWVSDAERSRREADARLDAKLDAWWASFHTTDPMFLRLVELVQSHRLPGDALNGRPGARRIVQHFRRGNPRASADLDWDLDAATITVQLYGVTGSRDRTLSFPHNLEGIEAAAEAIAQAFAR